jgi:hypothetical protein
MTFSKMVEDLENIEMTDSYAITRKYKTDSEFSQAIEFSAMENGETIIDTLLAYCDEHDIDEELITKLLTQSIKEKIKEEAIELRLMDSETGTLDI